MQSRISRIVKFISSIGALAGIGLFATGCHESPHFERVSEPAADITACCGTDMTAQNYNACVEAYHANGVCSSPVPKPDDPLPLYGMPDPIPPTTAQIEECCGFDDGSTDYKECVENYKDVNNPPICSHSEPIAIYGPDPTWCCGPEWDECSNTYFNGGGCTSGIDPSESEACCAQAEDPGACVLDFIKTKKCPTDIVEPTDKEIEDCCMMSDYKNDAECEKKYKETGVCDNEDMVQCCNDLVDDGLDISLVNASCVDIMHKEKQCSQDLKDCCQIPDGTYNDTCVELYHEKGSCDSSFSECCKKADGNFDKQCVESFNKNGQCDSELINCCKSEDGSINRACSKIMEDTKECINDKDELECCSKEYDEWNYITVSYTCIRYYKKVNQYNVCAEADGVNGGIATIYGGDFRPLPFEWCDDYKGDYEKCLDFAKCDVNLQEEEAKQCCGQNDTVDGYADCLDAYKEKGKSESCLQPLNEGEPAPNTNPIACCGKGYTETLDYNGVGEMEPTPWEKCVDTYVKTGECIGVPEDEPGGE